MNARIRIVSAIGVLLSVSLWPAVARAVLVLKKGSNQPITGFLVSETPQAVVVREILPDGKQRDLSFLRSEIEELIITVSPERLAELDPAEPKQYREYAEELAEKRRDPEARAAAIRLYQIAAVLDSEKLGRGAMLGMISLARSPQEEAKLRAAEYLLDPRHDASVLVPTTGIRTAPTAATRDALRPLLRALQLARRGRGVQAKLLADQEAVQRQLKAFEEQLTLEELYAACSTAKLSDAQLHKVLGLEIAIETKLAGESAETAALKAAQKPWSDAVARGEVAAMPSLDLERLTEFDPRACLYRNGEWVRPDGK